MDGKQLIRMMIDLIDAQAEYCVAYAECLQDLSADSMINAQEARDAHFKTVQNLRADLLTILR